MKKRIIFIYCLIFLISLTSCAKNSDSNKQNVSQAEKTENLSEEKTEKKSDNEKIEAKKIDKDILNFTKPYLDMYDQENNAFIKLEFKNPDFLSKDLWNKVSLIELEPNEPVKFYNAFISCEDDIRFKITNSKYEDTSKEDFQFVNLSKGEFFVIAVTEKMEQDTLISVTAYKEPNLYSQGVVYSTDYYADDNTENINFVDHSAMIWKAEDEPEIFAKEKILLGNTTDGYFNRLKLSIDLDGDNSNERIEFSGQRDIMSMEYDKFIENISKLLINDNKYNLIDLGKIDSQENEYYIEDVVDIDIIDIDPNDGKKEIVLFRMSEFNGYYIANVYHYEKGDMKYLGKIECGYDKNIRKGVKNGNLTLEAEGFALGFNYIYDKIYTLKNDKIEEITPDIIVPLVFNGRVTVKTNENSELNLYEKTDSKEPMSVIPPLEHLVFLETDTKSYIKVKTFSGETGYILFEDVKEEEGTVIFKGQDKEVIMYDVFENLPAWG